MPQVNTPSGKLYSSLRDRVCNGKTGKVGVNQELLFTMELGKTYKYRVCNVGLKASLNFRIQGHKLKLVEMEGSHTVQNLPKDYYMVASTRFLKEVQTTTAIIRYKNGKGEASTDFPPAPIGWACLNLMLLVLHFCVCCCICSNTWSLNQFRTFRWNLTASAARPNPQGSYRYGAISITRTIRLVNSVSRVNGKLRYGFNGVSHTDPNTPLKLAEYFNLADNLSTDKFFKYNVIKNEPEKTTTLTIQPNPGTWSPEKRENYNLLDVVSRHTVQVFPKSRAAILLTFDNAGMWNISVLSPEKSLRDEYNIPEDTPLCGIVAGLPKPSPYTI
ncbi:hypothetical protein ES319_D13G246100v1 [Gossypium barbadense]|uniref:Plastocyanin-like domain-containing protein n=1 Tax=Gossypium barbadense TaxID=3634 RepID=A0A5J5NV94_GOSBA|nr:hypothetical protein ES319_D13G246100v1 [Gossypium barbadense]